MSEQGPVPRDELEVIDSQIHHLLQRQTEDRTELRALSERVRLLELSMHHISQTLRFWLPVLATLIGAVLTTVIVK